MSEDSSVGVLADCTDINCTHVSLTGVDQPSSVLCIENETVLTNNTDMSPSQIIGNKSFLIKLKSVDFQNIDSSDFSIHQTSSDVDNIANSVHTQKIKKRIPAKLSVHFSPDYSMELSTNLDEESWVKEDKSDHMTKKTEMFSKTIEKPKNVDKTTTDMLTKPKGKDRVIEKGEIEHLNPDTVTESVIGTEFKKNTCEKDSLEPKSEDDTSANKFVTRNPDNSRSKKRKLMNTVFRKISVPFSFDTSDLTESGKVHEDNNIGHGFGTLHESNAEMNELSLETKKDTNSSLDFENINGPDSSIDQTCSAVDNIANSFHIQKMKKRIPAKISVHFSPDYTMDLSTNLDEESGLKEDKSDNITKKTDIVSKNNEQPKDVNKMSADMLTKQKGKDTLIENDEMVLPVDTKFMEIEHLNPDMTTESVIGNEFRKNTCEEVSLEHKSEDGTTANKFVTRNTDNGGSIKRKLKNTVSRKISVPFSFDSSNLTESGKVHEDNKTGLDSGTLKESYAEIKELGLETKQDTNSSPDSQNIDSSDYSIHQASSGVDNIASSVHTQKIKKRIPAKISVHFSPDYSMELSTNLDEESWLKKDKSNLETKNTEIFSKNNEKPKNVDITTTDMLTKPKGKDKVIENGEMECLHPDMTTESVIGNEFKKNTCEEVSLEHESEDGTTANKFVTRNPDNAGSIKRKLKNTVSRKISVPFSFDSTNLTESGKVHEDNKTGLDSGTLKESYAEINELSLETKQVTNSSPDFQNINGSDSSIDQACNDVDNIVSSLHTQRDKKTISARISVHFSPDYTMNLSTNLDEESLLKENKSDHVTETTEIISKNNEKSVNVNKTGTVRLTNHKGEDRVIERNEKDEMEHVNLNTITESFIRNEFKKNMHENDSLEPKTEDGTSANKFFTKHPDNSGSKKRKLMNTVSRKISDPFSFDSSKLTESGKVHEDNNIGLDSGTLKESIAKINELSLETEQDTNSSPDFENINGSDSSIDQGCSDVDNIANSLHTQKMKKRIPARISVHFSPDYTMDLTTNLDEESLLKEDKSDNVTKKTDDVSKNNDQPKDVNKMSADMLTKKKGKDILIENDEMVLPVDTKFMEIGHLNPDTTTESVIGNEFKNNTYEEVSLEHEIEYGTTANKFDTPNLDNAGSIKRKLMNIVSRKISVPLSFDSSNLTESGKVHEDNKTGLDSGTLKESYAEINELRLENKQDTNSSPDFQNINGSYCSIDQACSDVDNIASSLHTQKDKKTIPGRISVHFSPDYTMDLSTNLDEESLLKEDKLDRVTKKTEIVTKNNEQPKNVNKMSTDMLTNQKGKDTLIENEEMVLPVDAKFMEMEHLNPDMTTESVVGNEFRKNTCEEVSLEHKSEDGTTANKFVTRNTDNGGSIKRKLKNTVSRKISVPFSFDSTNLTESGKVHEDNKTGLDSGTLKESYAEINEFSLETKQVTNSSPDFQNINGSYCSIDQACNDVDNIASSLHTQRDKKTIPARISVHFSPDYTMDLSTNLDEESLLKEDKSDRVTKKTEIVTKNNEQPKNVNKMSTDMLTKQKGKDTLIENDEMVLPVDAKFMEMEHLNPDMTTESVVGNEFKKNTCEEVSLEHGSEDGTTANKFDTPNPVNAGSKKRKLKNTVSRKISLPFSYDTSNLTKNGKVHENNKIAHGFGTLKESNAEINELGLETKLESYKSPDIQNINRSMEHKCSDSSGEERINQNHVFACPDIPSLSLRERSVNNKSVQHSKRHRKDDLHHSEVSTKKSRTFHSTASETDGFIQDISIISNINAKAHPQKMFHSTPISKKTFGKNKSKLKGCNNTKDIYREEQIQHDDKMIQVSKTIFGSSTEVTNGTLSGTSKKSGEFSYFSTKQPHKKNKSQIKESTDPVYSAVEMSKELESSEEGRSYMSDFLSTLDSEKSHFTRSYRKRVTFKDVSAIENSPTENGSSSSNYSQRKSVKFRDVISLIDDDTVDDLRGVDSNTKANWLSVEIDVSNDESDLKEESKSKMARPEVSLDYATEIPEIILSENEIEENCEESTECSLYTKIKLMSKFQKEDKKMETRKTTLRNHKIVRNKENVRGSFENDSNYKNNDYEISGKKLRPPEKWVSRNLIKFFNEKLMNDNLDYIVNCERLVSILCSVVNAVKSLKNVNDIEFALLPLKNALVKYEICSNMIEYCTFISRFTPFEFQCKALPLGGFYGSVKRASNKILTDPILTDTEKISNFIDYSQSIQQ